MCLLEPSSSPGNGSLKILMLYINKFKGVEIIVQILSKISKILIKTSEKNYFGIHGWYV